jgi:hypothetical protein
VWVNALRTAFSDGQVFEPTYPIKDMTLLELEHAATSRSRFAARLWNELQGDQPLTPIAIRILRLHPPLSPEIEHPFGHFKNSVLVPGGRFLITSTNTDIVQLWDLGFHPNILINQCPLASVHVSVLDDDFELLVQPTVDQRGVLLLTTSNFQE